MLEPFDHDDLLALVRRLVPSDWYERLMSGRGGEVLHALAEVGSRVSQAVVRAMDGLAPGTAQGGSLATGSITITVTVATRSTRFPAGTRWWTLQGEVVVQEDGVVFTAPGQQSVRVVSQRPSWQANLRAGTLLSLLSRPGYEEPPGGAVWATVDDPGLAGGAAPCLDTLADTRGIGRSPGESDASLRLRVRGLADVVTPSAIRRGIAPVYPEAVLWEPWDLCAFADVAWWTDGDRSLGSPTARHNWPWDGHPTGWFAVWVPAPVVSVQDLQWLFADYAHTDYQDGYAATYLPGRASDGTIHDVGGSGVRPEVAAVAQVVETRRPGGTFWTLEEG